MKEVSREEFTAFFQSLTINDENLADLADLLETTKMTIIRWKTGQNVPTRSVRKSVIDVLVNLQ